MSHKSRRKTLSHSELESFLSEIDETKVEENNVKRKLKIDSQKNSLNNNNLQVIVDENNPNNINLLTNNEVSGESMGKEEKSFEKSKKLQSSDIDLIRKFCRNTITNQSSSIESMEIAKKVTESTNYQLLPNRLLYPNSFEHPASSLLGKKALLYSLAPLLTDAEKQRKIDNEIMEEYTRCQVGKSKSLKSSYEYKDIDINNLIPEEEYENRYLKFITLNKTKSNKSKSFNNMMKSNIEPILLQNPQAMDTNVNTTCELDGFIMNDDDDDDQVTIKQTNRNKRSRDRRTSIDTSMLSYLQTDNDNLIEKSIDESKELINSKNDEILFQFSNELDILLSDEIMSEKNNDCKIENSSQSNHEINDSIDLVNNVHLSNDMIDFGSMNSSSSTTSNNYVDFLDMSINTSDSLVTLPEPSTNSFTSVDLIGLEDFIFQTNESINTLSYHPIMEVTEDFTNELTDEQLLQEKELAAYNRMCFRYDQIKWKYQWEVVSIHACIKAKTFKK